MARYVSWIKTELARRFPEANLEEGVDLNRDGKLQETEQISDFDKSGYTGDEADWQLFFQKNRQVLQLLPGPFKWGKSFRVDNPIHDLLALESEMVPPEEVRAAYEMVEKILYLVRDQTVREALTPRARLRAVYDVIKSLGIFFSTRDEPLFVIDIKRRWLDCDTASFVFLAVGHEMGWPVKLVEARYHLFVRWEGEGSERFNMDFGEIRSDDDYRRDRNIADDTVRKGAYLKSLDRGGVRSLFFSNRGIVKRRLGRYQEAIADYDEAIRLNPNGANTHYLRGLALAFLERDSEAVPAYGRAIYRDRNMALAYYFRGRAEVRLERYDEAIADFDRAIGLDPDSETYSDRAEAKWRLGRYREAMADHLKALVVKLRKPSI